jgi:hypothetical protein
MESSIFKQLGLAILFWILYFLIVFLACKFIYLRLRGLPPAHPDAPALAEGKPTTKIVVWQDRERRLRRVFVAIGVFLMILPLFIPLLLKRLLS